VLKITIDLHPYGSVHGRSIGQLRIGNTGTSVDKVYGNYKIVVYKETDGHKPVYEGHIKQFKRSDGVWCLVNKAINNYLKKAKANDKNSDRKDMDR